MLSVSDRFGRNVAVVVMNKSREEERGCRVLRFGQGDAVTMPSGWTVSVGRGVGKSGPYRCRGC